MAPLSNYIAFLFFTTLLFPLQIIARDSQFFSKVTHFNNKEAEVSNKEGPVTNKPEEQQQPAFIPETENSYGLYGHDSDHLPATTTTNAAPYKTEFEDTSKYPNNNNKYYNNDAYNTKYYNKDAFGNNQDELSDTKYTEGGYNSMGHQNNNKKQYYFNNNAAANERYYSNNNNNNNYNYNAGAGANNRYNGERQGMSDTRFLEGGKYFYDVNYEKYNPTFYGDSSRGVNNNNWYNNRGGNNNVYHGNYNAYQNQEEFEDEQYDFEP